MTAKVALFLAFGLQASIPLTRADEPPVPVTIENFNRAETDLYFGNFVKRGRIGTFDHVRELAPIDEQNVVRLNRDTLYSTAVFDLKAGPVTITIPDTDGRFISMQVFDQNHYTVGVYYDSGDYTFERDNVGTRYLCTAFRTLIDPKAPGDAEKVHAIQDGIQATQASPGTFEVPNWDMASQKKVRDALNVLAETLPDRNRMFGSKAEVDPVRFLLGTSSAWGGNPDKDATYLNIVPEKNDGKTLYQLTVKDVPVKDFWSISIYNAEGYYEKNEEDLYTLNNLTAAKNADGSVTVQFGGKQGDAPNVLPVMPGWNYMVRLYRPAPEILKGEWKFPEAVAID